MLLADELRSIAEWLGQQEWIDHDPEFAACMWARAAILQSIAARLDGRVVVKPAVTKWSSPSPWETPRFSAYILRSGGSYTTISGTGVTREEALAALQALLDKEADRHG